MCQNSRHNCGDQLPLAESTRSRRPSQASGFTSTNGVHPSRRNSQRHIVPSSPAQHAATPFSTTLELSPGNLYGFTTPASKMTTLSDLPDGEILERILSYIEEQVEPGGKNARWCFRNASLQPPITPDSLAELDMPRIINNPKLRYDVNFDRELHFRPNTDGSKGRQKLQQADHYWRALEAEFIVYNYLQGQRPQPNNEHDWNRILKIALPRMPNIFVVVRDILKTLVPDQDQAGVLEMLDADHLIQQVHNGVCDLIGLSTWLAKVLKNHCAPMRDALVDTMQKMITNGASEGKPSLLVSGLRQLMNILEAMKLDVANHQIRHMRILLIDDTVKFQQKYNAHRIASGKIDISEATAWLHDEVESLEAQGLFPTTLEALVHGLIRELVTRGSSSTFPPTFYLDSDRLRVLRIELQTVVFLELCQQTLEDIVGDEMSASDLSQAREMLQESIPKIVGSSGKFVERLDYIAVEIVHVISKVKHRSETHDFSRLGETEQKLCGYIKLESREFNSGAQRLIDRLVPKIQARVTSHTRLSALQLQDILVPRPLPTRPILGFGATCEPVPLTMLPPPDPDEDIVRRFTHILVLHWKVWGDAVYSQSRDDDTGYETGSEISTGSLPSPALQIPVTTAVFASGDKFVPSHIVTHNEPSITTAPPASSGVATTRHRSSVSAEHASGLPSPPSTPEPEADSQNGEDVSIE